MPLPSPPKPSLFSPSRWFGRSASAGGSAPTRNRATGGAEADVEQLRTQARRRLIGAVVLLAVGVVAFPLVFETEPRPIGLDTPMQRVQPAGAGTGRGVVAEVPAGTRQPEPLPGKEAAPQAVAPAPPAATEPSVEPAVTVAAAPPSPAPETPATTRATPVETAVPPPQVASPPAVKPPSPVAAPATEAQRARALLEGRSPPAAPTPAPAARAATGEALVVARYVVQVGAFTEAGALRDARQRVERLGLKTYTQVINSPAGPRTRVRVGPFESRADADAAGAKLRAAGLPAAILTL
jgi:DedD protein